MDLVTYELEEPHWGNRAPEGTSFGHIFDLQREGGVTWLTISKVWVKASDVRYFQETDKTGQHTYST